MRTIEITLPSDVSEWAEQQAAANGASLDEFFAELTRQAQVRARQEHGVDEAELERLLLEAINSKEPAQPADAQWWADLRTEVEAELDKQNAVGKGTAP